MNIELYYLVLGSSGMFDTYTQWVATCCATLEKAEDYRAKASEASRAAIASWKESPEGNGHSYVYFTAPTKYDLSHQVYDTEVTYRVVPVPFVRGELDASGLLAIAEAFGSATAVTQELNNPGFSQRMRRPPPAMPAEVKGDFAGKLRSALAG